MEQTVDFIETQVVSPEMVDDALSNCFVSADDGVNRALEIVTPEEVGIIADDSDALDADSQEIETAAEVSLKNGVYHEIKSKLFERFQIPHSEIAFIHDANTPQKKADLFKAVNSGHVRVVISQIY